LTMIDWSLLRTPNVGEAFATGWETGKRERRERDIRGALSAFATNPDDPAATSALMTLDPATGMRAAEYQQQRAERARDQRYRSALGSYLKADVSSPGRQPGVAPVPNALAGFVAPADAEIDQFMPGLPGAPVGARPAPVSALSGVLPAALTSPSVGAPMSPQDGAPADIMPEHGEALATLDSAYREMLEADPVKAAEFRKQQYADLKSRLDTTSEAYGFVVSRLANVTDDAGYQQVLAGAERMFGRLGINVREFAPPTYPGPQGVRSLLMSAMDAQRQVIAIDRRAKLDWDIRDDEVDNARSDRSVARQEYYRARSDSRAERADARSAVRFKERDKDRAAIAAGMSGIRTDLSDLDY
jgi:hypothetical protein